MSRPFKSEGIIEEKVTQIDLKGFHVGFDQNKFRLGPLVDIIRSVIPEFAFGYDKGQVNTTEIVEVLKEAASTVYDTDKYKKRGEFGEIILHLLLRDFCNTIPLISKIYFKDTMNVPIHGFDGVQVTVSGNDKKLWLGESKLYSDGKDGVKDLANDVINHVKANYLRKEFLLISRKLPNSMPDVEYWRDLMKKHTTLNKIFSSIIIPLVCTYTCDIFKNHNNETPDYFNDLEDEIKTLYKHFIKHHKVPKVDILLMLLPVPDKDKLNQQLNKRLKHMQNI